MKKQITTNFVLPPYITTTLYDDGFVIKVTRQISEKDFDRIHRIVNVEPCGVPDSVGNVYNYHNRSYITLYKSYNWYKGYYPTKDDVLLDAKNMHNYVMKTVLSVKLMDMQSKISSYNK